MKGQSVMYSQDIADAICEQIADGKSLRAICEQEGMPTRATVFRWLGDERFILFRDRYARAREAQADVLFDEIKEIADDTRGDTIVGEDGTASADHEWIARARLRVDARKWMAGKLRPKVYGDRLDISGGMAMHHTASIAFEQMSDAELQAAMHKQMLALGMTVPGKTMDVIATEIKADEALDLIEVNKSLGDIKESK